MKLSRIVLNGFKSFADKTEFVFDRDITAIVGPNGCGKSNVVDAMKWVLGNQSPKQLRSGQMADVIFSGSSSRKPSGMAEVRLFFSDVRGLGIEQDDLEVARRLYRSGESEYFINNKASRLRDIRELFMDTGIGVSAYSIIEQGQIEQLLHASKTDRRTIFEEAAGISKFKAHKKEAMRKMERAEQNLLRLADIIAEIQKQLRSVKLQAGKARNYLMYSERLKELRVNYSLSEYDKMYTQRRQREVSLGELEDKFGQMAAEVARHDASMSEMGTNIMESESQINRWGNTLVAATSKIEQQLDRIDFLKGRVEELTERKNIAAEQIRQSERQSDQFTQQLAGCESNLEDSQRQYDEKKSWLEELEAVVHEVNRETGRVQAELEDEKSGIIDIVRRTAQLHNEIKSIGVYHDSLGGQKDRLYGRVNESKQQLTGLVTEKAQYRARLDDINGVLSQLQDSLSVKRDEMSRIDSTLAATNESLVRVREQRSGMVSELNVLSDMEVRGQGLSDSLREILNSRQDGDSGRFGYVEGIVADIISTDIEHAAVVEAALEGMTDALVINSTEAFLDDTEIHEKLDTRIKVICADRIEPFVEQNNLSAHPSVLGRLIEFVNCDSKHARLAWKLLGHVVLVESIEAAMKLSARLGAGYRFVTPDAQVLDGAQCISLGPVGKSSGLISRKSRIHQLERVVGEVTSNISQLEAELVQNTRHNEHLARLCKDFRTSIYEANTEKVDAESKLGLLEQSIKRLIDEQPVLASEICVIEEEMSQSVQKEHDSKEKLEELETINTQRIVRIAELQQQYEDGRGAVETHSVTLTELKVQIGQFAEQQKAMQQQIASLQSQLQQGRMTIASARSEQAGSDEQIIQAQRNILAGQGCVSELYVEKEQAQRISEQLHEQVETLLVTQKETTALLKEKRAVQADVEEKLHEIKVELGQLQVRQEDLTQRVQEELGIDLAEAYGDFQQQDVDWQEVRNEITELRGKIERVGNVNVDAIEQQDQLEQRYNFLAEQVEDLNKSRSQLEQLIGRINKDSREKFRTTFEQVRENFQVLFRKLFGGGKADILLEDPEDILECGIEIVARPPGKETRSISLLSGGEKTMTAISLLFAVFKCKPSPFCFLDEVDAALDEANNERFNMVVQEFKKDSQFVIITHSKRTMSVVDMLYGVTMQTKGVSKKISVQFDSVEDVPDTAVA